MFRRLFSTAQRQTLGTPESCDQDADAAAMVVNQMKFEPMTPLEPPPARNDDPMRDLYAAVEEELRAAGYLPGKAA